MTLLLNCILCLCVAVHPTSTRVIRAPTDQGNDDRDGSEGVAGSEWLTGRAKRSPDAFAAGADFFQEYFRFADLAAQPTGTTNSKATTTTKTVTTDTTTATITSTATTTPIGITSTATTTATATGETTTDSTSTKLPLSNFFQDTLNIFSSFNKEYKPSTATTTTSNSSTTVTTAYTTSTTQSLLVTSTPTLFVFGSTNKGVYESSTDPVSLSSETVTPGSVPSIPNKSSSAPSSPSPLIPQSLQTPSIAPIEPWDTFSSSVQKQQPQYGPSSPPVPVPIPAVPSPFVPAVPSLPVPAVPSLPVPAVPPPSVPAVPSPPSPAAPVPIPAVPTHPVPYQAVTSQPVTIPPRPVPPQAVPPQTFPTQAVTVQAVPVQAVTRQPFPSPAISSSQQVFYPPSTSQQPTQPQVFYPGYPGYPAAGYPNYLFPGYPGYPPNQTPAFQPPTPPSVKQEVTNCFSQSGVQGVCVASPEACAEEDGQSAGPCSQGLGGSTGGVCCVYQSYCGYETNKELSYLRNPNYPGNVTAGITNCPMRVSLLPGVCQIRVDFLDVELKGLVGGECEDRNAFSMVASDTGSATQPVRTLCGKINQGGGTRNPHLYMQINQAGSYPAQYTSSPMSVMIRVRTDSFPSRWNIRITQIFCNGGPLQAPDGCDQWFPQAAGNITSFNLDQRVYNRNSRVTSCIKGDPAACGIQYRLNYLSLLTVNQPRQTLESGSSCQDYLLVNGEPAGYCGQLTSPQTLTFSSRLPQYLTFYSNERKEKSGGYSVEYSYLRNCAPPPTNPISQFLY